MVTNTISHRARELHDYMAFRANREGVAHTLGTNFYAEHLSNGVQRFFGVLVDLQRGLVQDEQQPELFKEWHKLNATDN